MSVQAQAVALTLHRLLQLQRSRDCIARRVITHRQASSEWKCAKDYRCLRYAKWHGQSWKKFTGSHVIAHGRYVIASFPSSQCCAAGCSVVSTACTHTYTHTCIHTVSHYRCAPAHIQKCLRAHISARTWHAGCLCSALFHSCTRRGHLNASDPATASTIISMYLYTAHRCISSGSGWSPAG